MEENIRTVTLYGVSIGMLLIGATLSSVILNKLWFWWVRAFLALFWSILCVFASLMLQVSIPVAGLTLWSLRFNTLWAWTTLLVMLVGFILPLRTRKSNTR